jgi:hypothetical protein
MMNPNIPVFSRQRRQKTESKIIYIYFNLKKKKLVLNWHRPTFMICPASGLNSGFMCINSFKYSLTSSGIEPNLLFVKRFNLKSISLSRFENKTISVSSYFFDVVYKYGIVGVAIVKSFAIVEYGIKKHAV